MLVSIPFNAHRLAIGSFYSDQVSSSLGLLTSLEAFKDYLLLIGGDFNGCYADWCPNIECSSHVLRRGGLIQEILSPLGLKAETHSMATHKICDLLD